MANVYTARRGVGVATYPEHHAMPRLAKMVEHIAAVKTIVLTGSVITVVSAFWAAVDPNWSPFLLGLAGLVTAVGGILIGFCLPVLRIWVDERRADRAARIERHDLNNRINQLTIENERAKLERETMRLKIENDALRIGNLNEENAVLKRRQDTHSEVIEKLKPIADSGQFPSVNPEPQEGIRS
jgi:hypothetical protein